MKTQLSFFVITILWQLCALAAAGLAQDIKVKGQVVDDETGKPITKMMIQAGRRDPTDANKVTWGFTERRTSSKTGRFTTTVKWLEGWTARVVVDGYLPQPILSKAPAPGVAELDVVLRLKTGGTIQGRVVDHEGKPVAGVNLFAISPRGINLYGGQAHQSWSDEIDPRAKSVATDKDGRFKLPSGGAEAIAVSSKTLDAWTAKIKPGAEEELEIKLPAPTRLTIEVDIAGADAETEVFYQLLTHLMEGFKKVESTRTFKIKNGQSLELTSLPPGKYQFCRSRMHRYENIGMGAMIDREFLELKAGEHKTLRFVRKTGHRLAGVVSWPKTVKLAGVILTVQAVEPKPDPWDKHNYTTVFDSRLIAGKPQLKVIDGDSAAFKTEMLAPGKYKVEVVAYSPMTPEEMRFTGIRRPDFTASEVVVVSEKSAPNMLVIELGNAKK